jgi:hypothetical protein
MMGAKAFVDTNILLRALLTQEDMKRFADTITLISV